MNERLLESARLGATLMASALMHSGWIMIDREGTGAQTLRTSDRAWPAGVPLPRIEVRPLVGGRGSPWWHWTAPAWIADVPIAPVNNNDQTMRMLRASLPKITAAAVAVAARAPAP